MSPLNLNGPATSEQLSTEQQKPSNSVDVSATDVDGGTVRAEVTSTGSYWSASAWYQWAKDKGRGYGAKVGLKF